VLGERVVEVELPGVAQLQHRDGGEGLRDRGDRVLRVRRGVDALFDVGEPDRLAPDELPAAKDTRADAR
jgi:hypothetical protein